MRDPLSVTLFSKSQASILGLLYGRPDESYYFRQIVTQSGLGVGHVQRELESLSTAGIIERTRKGQHVYYRADARCPIYQELRSIITKTIGPAAVLRDVLDPLKDRIKVAFIFGSVARGEERHASDLDLFVIGKATFRQTVDAIRPAEATLQRTINPTVYPIKEFRDKLAAGNHFLQSVIKGEKFFILGDDRELGKLSA